MPIRLRQTPATYRLTGVQHRHRLIGVFLDPKRPSPKFLAKT